MRSETKSEWGGRTAKFLCDCNGKDDLRVLQKQHILLSSGIYAILSRKQPHRVYIGSAVRLSYRKSNHFVRLRIGDHSNKKLQGHFNKYGEGDLKFIVLELVPAHQLIEVEQIYLDKIKPSFNICTIARNTLGRKQSVATRMKRSVALMGRRPSNETRIRMSLAARNRRRQWNHTEPLQ